MKIQNNTSINSIVSKDIKDIQKETAPITTGEGIKKYDVIDIKAPIEVKPEIKVDVKEKVTDAIVNKLKEDTSPDKLAEIKHKLNAGGYIKEGSDLVLKIIL